MVNGVDDSLDEVGVMLKEEIYCGGCNARMAEVSKNRFKCSKCGEVYEEK